MYKPVTRRRIGECAKEAIVIQMGGQSYRMEGCSCACNLPVTAIFSLTAGEVILKKIPDVAMKINAFLCRCEYLLVIASHLSR
jgi:hypothetical protein